VDEPAHSRITRAAFPIPIQKTMLNVTRNKYTTIFTNPSLFIGCNLFLLAAILRNPN